MIPQVKARLLDGKKGLIVGIANQNSIAWAAPRRSALLGPNSQ
jgi:enoyl-[acyl-carrier protein] reductase I